MNPAQLELFMAGIESTEPPSVPAEAAAGVAAGDSLTSLPADPPAASGPKEARRPRLPGDLPIVEEIIDPASCLTHIRRGFIGSKAEAPIRAGWIIRQMAHLYQLEGKLRQSKASPKLREAARCAQAGPILGRLEKAFQMCQSSGRHLPKSAFGAALNYALNAWSGMQSYLRDGRIEIDVIRRIPTTPADQMHTLTPATWAAEKKHRPMPAPAPVTPAPAKPAPSAAA